MTDIVPPALDTWLPVLGVLWVASLMLLVVSMRRYAATRDHVPAGPEPAFITQRQQVDHAYTPMQPITEPDEGVLAGAGEPEPSQVDERPLTAALDAVRARIARDRASALGLVELVRALYLDGSTFTFDTIGVLSSEDRALAKTLVDAWLADPTADDWKDAYDAVREVASIPPATS